MLGEILLNGLVYCGLLTVVLAIMSFGNPRVMLQKYPPEIQVAVTPKTSAEKKQTYWYVLPFLIVMLLYPLIVVKHEYDVHPLSLTQIFGCTWALMLIFNLYDLLILDWLVFCTLTPKFIIVKGSEGNNGYKNYRFHFTGFLKGIAITFILAILISVVTKIVLSNHQNSF
jgi:hypothetical protein